MNESAFQILDVFGSNSYPCTYYDAINNLGCTITNCNSTTYDPVCIGEIPIDNTYNWPGDANLLPIPSFEYVNEESFPINYIIYNPKSTH